MKSLVLLALAFVVVVTVPPAASQSENTTDIPFRTETDKWEKKGSGPTSRSYSAGNPEAGPDESHSRQMVLTIDRTTPVERIQISVVDGRLKDTILFDAEGWELLKLKELVDKAVADYRADREILRAVNSSKEEGATRNAD
jgi:hypothetical protein